VYNNKPAYFQASVWSDTKTDAPILSTNNTWRTSVPYLYNINYCDTLFPEQAYIDESCIERYAVSDAIGCSADADSSAYTLFYSKTYGDFRKENLALKSDWTWERIKTYFFNIRWNMMYPQEDHWKYCKYNYYKYPWP
jgi:hypothetical protein